jgi:NAD(P)-dependent dehydrogenase (short-subunit alcohol dehydrogenase family)
MPVVVITGASRGIGYSFAKYYSEQGYSVIAACRRSNSQNVRKLPVTVYDLDVSDCDSIAKFKTDLSDLKIDILINNAGIASKDTFGNISRKSLMEQLNVNAVSPVLVTQALAENLSPGAKLIFITSSLASLSGNKSGGYYGIRSSKAALNMLVKCMGISFKQKGIGCLAIHPGFVKTDMSHNIGAIGPDESVKHMAAVIERFRVSNSGTFVDNAGNPIAW